jgi:hypothetical protein
LSYIEIHSKEFDKKFTCLKALINFLAPSRAVRIPDVPDIFHVSDIFNVFDLNNDDFVKHLIGKELFETLSESKISSTPGIPNRLETSYLFDPETISTLVRSGRVGERIVLNLLKIPFPQITNEEKSRYLEILFAHLSGIAPYEFANESVYRIILRDNFGIGIDFLLLYVENTSEEFGKKFTCLKVLVDFLLKSKGGHVFRSFDSFCLNDELFNPRIPQVPRELEVPHSLDYSSFLKMMRNKRIGKRVVLGLIKIPSPYLADEERIRYSEMVFAYLSKTEFPINFSRRNLFPATKEKIGRKVLAFFPSISRDPEKNIMCLDTLFRTKTEKHWKFCLGKIKKEGLELYLANARALLNRGNLSNLQQDILRRIELHLDPNAS